MLNDEKVVRVTNRDNGIVGYSVPDLGLHRTFEVGETKEIPVLELRKLSYLPGGKFTLRELLCVEDDEIITELLNENMQPEYFYTTEDIKNLLLNGSLDQLKDALDFAPEGVIDQIKQLAIDLEIVDISKRDAITQATGMDISKAIANNKITKEADEDKPVEKQRRVAVPEKAKPEGRRAKAYKVIE